MIVRRIDPNTSELYHHGIEGQRWGIRRYQNPDGSLTPAGMKRYNKMAKKDAKEYARAQMFYGEGAGNRRKLIKAKVEERSKDENYKKLFDSYLSEQNMEEHAEKAQTERKVRDAKNAAAKTARGVKNLALGTGATVTTGAVVAYSAYNILKNTGIGHSAVKKASNVGRSYANKYRNTKFN